MSLKKKLAFSFLISVFIIAVLIVFEYANFIKIRKEIRHFEVTDTIRSRSLELRRHEKNFFLYPLKAKTESEAVHGYVLELNEIINKNEIINRSVLADNSGKLQDLKVLLVFILLFLLFSLLHQKLLLQQKQLLTEPSEAFPRKLLLF
jgi:hypothetical protein